MAKQAYDINVKGLTELRRDLRAVDRETLKEVQATLKAAAQLVSTQAAGFAPRRTGALAASYRAFTRGNVAGVRSRLPYAGVIEYGGTISPKGTPITIRRYEPITRAVELQRDRIIEALGDGLERTMSRTGGF